MRILALLISAAIAVASAQAPQYPDFSRWDIVDLGGRAMPYLNRPSLYLERGIALMPEVQFGDGTIEFDVAIHGQMGFAGVVFRATSNDDYELVYVRTHRSRQWDALQYTPLFTGQEGWQLYTGAGYNGVAELPANRWVHIRVVVEGYRAEVYVDGATAPQLVVSDLKRAWTRGRVGLWGRGGAANFSNMKVTPLDRPVPASRAAQKRDAAVVMNWAISQSMIAAKVPIDRVPADLQWETVAPESTGLLNIARYRRPAARSAPDPNDDQRDTVYVRTVLDVSRAHRVRLSFGYSDEVTVFLDGRALFTGRAGYLLRDGSYLGTLALGPDSLWLDLSTGRHEVIFAVSEAFGGWGVIAKVD